MQATDPLVWAGLSSYLAAHPDIVVVVSEDRDFYDVIVVVGERFTATTVSTLRLTAATGARPVVLVISDIDESQLLTAVRSGVVSVLPELRSIKNDSWRVSRP